MRAPHPSLSCRTNAEFRFDIEFEFKNSNSKSSNISRKSITDSEVLPWSLQTWCWPQAIGICICASIANKYAVAIREQFMPIWKQWYSANRPAKDCSNKVGDRLCGCVSLNVKTMKNDGAELLGFLHAKPVFSFSQQGSG